MAAGGKQLLAKNLNQAIELKFYFRIPFLNKSDLKPMRALAENVFLDCMTKESDIISYVIASQQTGLYFDFENYSF